MSLSDKFRRVQFRSFIKTVVAFPRIVWILLAGAFILGFLIRGGGGEAHREVHEHAQETGDSTAQVWTCSMHPQIRLPEPGQCPICFMDLIPLETQDTDEGPRELKMSPTAVKLAEIVTMPVHRGTAETEVRLSGKVTYDESRLGKITAWVPGRLERLYVDYTGTRVQKGESLVKIYSPSIYAAQEEFLQALKLTRGSTSKMAKESALITLEASREKLRQLGLTDDQISEIESRGTAEDRITIVSPLSGVVIHKNALEGLYVDRGTQIYTIADLRSVWVVLDAYESDLHGLKKGQRVDFNVEAVPGQTFHGEVIFISPVLNETTRTIEVRLNADNKAGLLKPGMFVRATIHARIAHAAGEHRPPLLIPASAVLKTGKRAVVYVKKPNTEEPVFEGREVELGSRAGEYYIVRSGVKEGEDVVVKGNFKIDSAFQIAAKPSMMNPEGGLAVTGHQHHGAGVPSKVEESAESKLMPKGETLKAGRVFLKNLQPVYAAYFEAQAALADDDFTKAKAALARLEKSIQSVSEDGLEGHLVHQWQDLREDIHSVAQHAHHWANIEAARNAFNGISTAVLEMERTFGHMGNETHYEIFCPMAFDNKGATWMQNHDTVDNPYFGAAMLTCGEVRDTFSPKR